MSCLPPRELVLGLIDIYTPVRMRWWIGKVERKCKEFLLFFFLFLSFLSNRNFLLESSYNI